MTRSKPLRVAFDSCCLSGIINGEGEYAPLITYLDAIESGNVICVLPTMILAEVFKGKDRPNYARVRELLDSDKVEWVDLSTMAARKAAQLREVHTLKGEDAVILACSLVGRADIIFSNDKRFPYGNLENMRVLKPESYGQPHLFQRE